MVIERDTWRTNREEGRQEGEQKGREEGKVDDTRQGIVRALQRGKLTPEEIAEDFAVSLETVLTIRQEMTHP